MKERPILFSAPMVRTILEGRKTQTRRVMKSQPYTLRTEGFGYPTKAGGFVSLQSPHCLAECPYGKPGDRLWVRETFAPWRRTCIESPLEWESLVTSEDRGGLTLNQWVEERGHHEIEVAYRADTVDNDGWMPSIFMPRWASRITLEITEVRVQRLHEISCQDVWDEGSEVMLREYSDGTIGCVAATSWYRKLWESINGAGSWAANPWVWALSFQRVEGAGLR